jgi:ribonucleoside-triphosphate reductase
MKRIEHADIPQDIIDRAPEDMSIEDEHYKQFKNAYEYAVEMTRKETYQAAEGLYHNLNSLKSRGGGQLPFTSLNYGTCTLPEGRLVINALLDNSIKGVGKLHIVNGVEQGFTPIFPCGIFQLAKGINRKPGDPNYDMYRKALRSTAKRLYPNYANVDWSGNAGYDPNDPKTIFSTMGCRTANLWDANGFGQLKDGRGNICPVTIILPTLAMMSGGNVDKFMEILDQKIHEAKDQLIERFEHICKQPISAAKFMWENNMMAGFDGVNTRSALKHGTLAIGQLGLAEALQILVGCDHTEPKGMELAKRIEALFQKRCKEFKTEEHTAPEDGSKYYLNFGVYYSPKCNI